MMPMLVVHDKRPKYGYPEDRQDADVVSWENFPLTNFLRIRFRDCKKMIDLLQHYSEEGREIFMKEYLTMIFKKKYARASPASV
jgi:hypothetical protein